MKITIMKKRIKKMKTLKNKNKNQKVCVVKVHILFCMEKLYFFVVKRKIIKNRKMKKIPKNHLQFRKSCIK